MPKTLTEEQVIAQEDTSQAQDWLIDQNSGAGKEALMGALKWGAIGALGLGFIALVAWLFTRK